MSTCPASSWPALLYDTALDGGWTAPAVDAEARPVPSRPSLACTRYRVGSRMWLALAQSQIHLTDTTREHAYLLVGTSMCDPGSSETTMNDAFWTESISPPQFWCQRGGSGLTEMIISMTGLEMSNRWKERAWRGPTKMRDPFLADLRWTGVLALGGAVGRSGRGVILAGGVGRGSGCGRTGEIVVGCSGGG